MSDIRVVELFAGVGGFRLGLEAASDRYKVIWANQWEPPGNDSKQFAWHCYEERFGEGSCVNEDINKVLDDYESGADRHDIPDEIDMVDTRAAEADTAGEAEEEQKLAKND